MNSTKKNITTIQNKYRFEKDLHEEICEYITLQYPNVLFNTDLSGIRLTMGQAKQVAKLRSCNGFPDIFIYQANKYYNALFLEIKLVSPYKKNGELKKNKHLKQQLLIHQLLRKQHYLGEFVWTFEQAKQLIDNYLG